MGKDILYAWTTGHDRCTHAGFGVCWVKAHGKSAVEAEYPSAEEAVRAAEQRGPAYAAFRLVRIRGKTTPEELVTQADLPVRLVAKLGPRKRARSGAL